MDAFWCVLELMASGDAGRDLMALDFSDEFWQVSLHKDELRYFCTQLEMQGVRKFIVYFRLAQGSRGAPTSWASLAALIVRLTQSIFMNVVSLLCYVGDLLCIIRGGGLRTQVDRRLHHVFVGGGWVTVAAQKGAIWQQGDMDRRCSWGGQRCRHCVFKESLLDDIWVELKEYSSPNIISIKALQYFAGKLNNVAILLVVLRTFLQPMWPSIYMHHSPMHLATLFGPSSCYSHCIGPTPFLQGTVGGIFRRSDLAACQRVGPRIEIGSDVSPFGLGGWISRDGSIFELFASPITPDDGCIFGIVSTDSKGQQLWECLARLVALRLWLPLWSDHRLNLPVRGDNVGALALLLKMRPHDASHAVIARELAVVLIQAPFFLEVIHTPEKRMSLPTHVPEFMIQATNCRLRISPLRPRCRSLAQHETINIISLSLRCPVSLDGGCWDMLNFTLGSSNSHKQKRQPNTVQCRCVGHPEQISGHGGRLPGVGCVCGLVSFVSAVLFRLPKSGSCVFPCI